MVCWSIDMSGDGGPGGFPQIQATRTRMSLVPIAEASNSPADTQTAESVHTDGHVCFPPVAFRLGASPHRVRKMIEECQRLPTSDWCVWPCQSHIAQHGHRFPTEQDEVEMYFDQ